MRIKIIRLIESESDLYFRNIETQYFKLGIKCKITFRICEFTKVTFYIQRLLTTSLSERLYF